MTRSAIILCLAAWNGAAQQERQVLKSADEQPSSAREADGTYVLRAGTRVPLTLMNSVSSKNAAPGDRIYLQTMIPVAVEGRVLIPAGTYVTGSITETKRPGRVKGKGQLAVRFEQLLFPSGQSLNLAGRIGALDGDNPGQLNRDEGKVSSAGSVGKDAAVVGGTAVGGTAMGNWIGGEGKGAGIGAGAGAATGLAAVLLTRGPEATLTKGSTIEMVLSQDFRVSEQQVRAAEKGGPGR